MTPIIGDSASRVLTMILYGAAFLGFIAATLRLFGWLVTHELWRTLAVVSTFISLVALALYQDAFATLFPNKLGAIAVDIAVLLGLLVLN